MNIGYASSEYTSSEQSISKYMSSLSLAGSSMGSSTIKDCQVLIRAASGYASLSD